MMNQLTRKRNQKGFTLMEMLIVVAIIAILVAISIPVFTSQLENARAQTDAANERAAKAVAVTQYLTDGLAGTWKYDAVNGKLVDTTTALTGYGKTTAAPIHNGLVIQVAIASTGTVTITWVAGATTTP